MKHSQTLYLFLAFLLAACAPAQATPLPAAIPQPVRITEKVVVTRLALETPTPRVIVATGVPTPTFTPTSPAAIRNTNTDWIDYGGICIRPDNIPAGTQINPDTAAVDDARTQVLSGLWRVVAASESAGKLTPSFSNLSRFLESSSKDIRLRGPFIPVGETGRRSDAWSFNLEDPVELWKRAHPGEKFNGVALNTICVEFFNPAEFEVEKHNPANPNYFHLVGGVTHAIFAIEEALGAPRLVIKLYANPYNGTRDYAGLLGFTPSNTPANNALAANEHVGALVASLNYVAWGNFDSDGTFEFGYGPKNSLPLDVTSFHTLNLFTAQE